MVWGGPEHSDTLGLRNPGENDARGDDVGVDREEAERTLATTSRERKQSDQSRAHLFPHLDTLCRVNKSPSVSSDSWGEECEQLPTPHSSATLCRAAADPRPGQSPALQPGCPPAVPTSKIFKTLKNKNATAHGTRRNSVYHHSTAICSIIDSVLTPTTEYTLLSLIVYVLSSQVYFSVISIVVV